MKIFIKLYIGIMVILVSSLLISGYLMVDRSLKKSVNHEVDNCVQQYNLFLNAFQTNLIVATKNKIADSELVTEVTRLTKGNSKAYIGVFMNGIEVVYDLPEEIIYAPPEKDIVKYDIINVRDSVYVVCYSSFEKRGVDYTCVAAYDISKIVNENNSQRRGYYMIYVIVLIGGTLFAFFFAMHLTKPIRHLSEAGKAIADGDYGQKIEVISNDELGELTTTFNKMSETIREKMDDLELSVKQKEDFIAAFAHETKSPMTSIIGYADLIYQNKISGEEAKEAAGVIMNEGMRLQALSAKLMDIVSLKESGIVREEINTLEMLDDIKATITPKIEAKNAKVSYELTDYYIRVDYDLFKTVIINLVDNSLKAGADDIKIHGERISGGNYMIKLSDNGMGIPKDDLARVKDAFYMVDKSRSRKEHGAGLGLALADRIMKMHGGSIDIESEEGKGTDVILTIPYK